MFRHVVCFSVLLLLGSGAAVVAADRSAAQQAADALKDLVGQTAFAKIEALYDEGTAPTAADLVGWHSGRTFSIDEPNTPLGTFLAIGKYPGMVRGPLFAGDLMAISLFGPTPDHYDVLAPDLVPKLKARIVKLASSSGFLTLGPREASQTDGEWLLATTSSFRMARGFLVEQTTNVHGKRSWVSYYFIRHPPAP